MKTQRLGCCLPVQAWMIHLAYSIVPVVQEPTGLMSHHCSLVLLVKKLQHFKDLAFLRWGYPRKASAKLELFSELAKCFERKIQLFLLKR